MTLAGIEEVRARVRETFGAHEGHTLSFGRVYLGDKYDSGPFAYVGSNCETCRTLVDVTLMPTAFADIVDEVIHKGLK